MNENILTFSSTSVGYNHIKVNKVCEDASDWYSDEKMKICVVADGHGSDNYPRTDRGSRFAVDAAIKCIVDFVNVAETDDVLNDERNNFELMLQLAASILKDWYQSVENDCEKNPFTEVELEKVSDKYKKRFLSTDVRERRIEKAYGCTLIAYVVTEGYSFGLQIGDGKCVHVDKNGKFSEPIPWDEDCQMNVTTSICDDNAIEEFRFAISSQAPLAVFCGSDGIDDSYATPEELYALYRSIIKIFIEHGKDVGKKEIEEYLPLLSKKGSGDDVSIGIVLNEDYAKRIARVFDIQSEMFKLSGELKEKKQQQNALESKSKALRKKTHNDFENWLGTFDLRLGVDTEDMPSRINQMVKQLGSYGSEYQKLCADIQEIETKISQLDDSLTDFLYDIDVLSFVETNSVPCEVNTETSHEEA